MRLVLERMAPTPMGGVFSIVVLAMLLLLPLTSRAVEGVETRFEEANKHYVKGQYNEAAKAYEDLVEREDVSDPVLFHNLGNASYRAGQFGVAIFNYRRGLRASPAAELARDLNDNLEAAREALRDRYRSVADKSEVIYAEPGGLLYRLTHQISSDLLAGIFITVWILLMLFLALRRLKPSLPGLGGSAVASAVVVVLVALVLWGQVYTDSQFTLGVVLEDDVVLHEGRHEDARGVAIQEGMEVRVIEADSAWSRIELPGGRSGWVQSDQVGRI